MAAVRRERPPRPIAAIRGTAPSAMLAAAEPAKNAALSAVHRADFGGSEPLTMPAARSLYRPSWRAAAWRDGASAKPLTVYAVNYHPAISYGHVGCAGFRRLRLCRGRGRKAPGCLTSELEERETWTAESLRAASSNGEGLSSTAWLFPQECGHGRDFGGRRFRSTLWSLRGNARGVKVGPRQTL